jgi:hypothetical protein
MPKIYKINENLWFELHQSLLLKMFNHPDGRDLLFINRNLPPIVKVAKNYVECFVDIDSKGQVIRLSQFKGGSAIGNAIRYRWSTFAKMAKEFYSHREFGLHQHDVTGLLAATTDTFKPDAHPETDTVDGYVWRQGVDQIFTDIRTGSGTNSADSTNLIFLAIRASTTAGLYERLYRGITLFDTSSLLAGAVLTVVDYDLYYVVASFIDQLNGDAHANSAAVLVQTNPASDTSLTLTDYNNGHYLDTGSANLGEGDTQANIVIAGDGYTDTITANATGRGLVNLTGITKFGIAKKWDYDDTTTGLTWSSAGFQATWAHSADEVGKEPKLTVTYTRPVTITPNTLTLANTMPAPTVTGVAVVTPDPLTTTVTIPTPFVQVVLIQPSPLSLTTSMPAVTVDLPLIVTPDALVATVNILDPSILSQTAMISVHNFPAGKTVSYKIVDEFQVTLQDWTNVGVVEDLIDATAGRSIYSTKSNLVTSGGPQMHIMWKTDDATPLTASESIDIFTSQVNQIVANPDLYKADVALLKALLLNFV